jgi:glycosyltransferase involved in cell wall biosynthesis
MSNSLVSIIIPTFNRAHLIRETLDSVLAQTYTNWECIVVDDGSSDNTEEIVMNYVNIDIRFQYHKRPDNYKEGGNGSRNYGFKLSKGSFVNWFDSDDIMLPEFIYDKIIHFTSECNIVISSHYITDEFLNIKKSVDLIIKKNIFFDYVMWQSNFCIVTANVMFKKEYLLANNLIFNENIKRGQEAEFFSKIFRNLKENAYFLIKKQSFLYRQHENTKTNKSIHYNDEFVKNEIDNNFMNLEYAIQINEVILVKKLQSMLIEQLFISKKYSKKNYFHIINCFKICGNCNFKFQLLLLEIFFYFPNSSKINFIVYKLYLKC